MDRNLLLAIALSLMVLVLWDLWQGPRRAPERPPGEVVAEAPSARPEAGAPGRGPAEEEPAPVPPARERPPPPQTGAPERTLVMEDPLFRAEITTRGGGVRHWELREYTAEEDGEQRPIVLTGGAEGADGVALATPFEELGLGDLSRAVFQLERPNANTFIFFLEQSGLLVRKTLTFQENSYTFRLRLEVENGGSTAVSPRFAVRWPAHQRGGTDFREQALVSLHDGGVEKEMIGGLGQPGFLGFGSAWRVREYPGEIDWAGVDTNYFLQVLLPATPAPADARFVVLEPGVRGYTEIAFPPVTLGPGQAAAKEFRGYAGPKELDRLVALGSHADRSVDFGWSWVAPLTRFFAWMLRALYSIIPNYGWAIIVLTVLVRVVTAPLTTKQMRSMERMRALQPKLKEIQEKHKDDRQAQSEAMMALYRSEKVNPLGGCFPILLQMPVFIGLFYALRASIELRQAPFIAWIDDLSSPETLFVLPGLELPVRLLPLLMGASMVVQTRMTPQPAQTPEQMAQMKMMMTVMPIVMIFVFYQFPSGLVLYWMVSNVLGIAHQMWIRRQMPAPEAVAGAKAAGGRRVRSEK